jgi:hypothetical protein
MAKEAQERLMEVEAKKKAQQAKQEEVCSRF